MKQSVIISNKCGVYKISHKLPNDLRVMIVRIEEVPGKSQNFTELQPSTQSSSENEIIHKTSKKSQRVFRLFNKPNFQRVNGLLVLTFNFNGSRIGDSRYLQTAKVEDYVMIDGKIFFDQAINNDIKTYNNIRKIATVKELVRCQITIIL